MESIDLVINTNNNRTMKKLLCLSCLIIAATTSVRAGVVFSDDFNSTTTGNLAGQDGWLQNSTTTTAPVQVTGGVVTVGPTGQDLFKDIIGNAARLTLTDGSSLYIGMDINVTTAQTPGDYFQTWAPDSTTSTAFNGRTFVKATTGGYLLGYSLSSGTTYYGTTVLSYGTTYRVVSAYNDVAGALNDTGALYVNPTGAIGDNTAYVTAGWTATFAETEIMGQINLRQGTAANAPTLKLDNLDAGTAFGDAETFSVPEPTIAVLGGLATLGLVLFRRRN